MNTFDVIIVGGGLAGLTAAIQLTKENYRVLVIERESYPHHKVCGEYLSNEIVPYLQYLGVKLPTDISIDTLQFTTQKGRSLQIPLPLGGKGISRYVLDDTLYKRAIVLGATVIFNTVRSIKYMGDEFTVETDEDLRYQASFVIGAYGKRSNIDKFLDRSFVLKNSPWLAVKAHYKFDGFPDNLVGLHNFDGGYGGLSKTESGAINFCYLTTYTSFKKVRDIENFNASMVARNPFLARFLKDATPLFEKPLSIAQVSFEPKKAVENHILMCGDTAGLIHPLCGNGMAMAIHSAKIASELIDNYFKGTMDRGRIEAMYRQKWAHTFGKRLRTGRYLQSLLMSPKTAGIVVTTVAKSPRILKEIVRRTHGSPLDL